MNDTLRAALMWVLIMTIGILLRRRYLSVVSNIKGPFLASVSTAWHMWHVARGDLEYAVLREHRKHGDFVRIGNNEISCSHPDSIAAILAPPYRKAEWYQALAVPDKYHQTPMSECDPKRHRERSSITGSSYSLSYLIKSEDGVDGCIHELREKLHEIARAGKAFNIDQWLNYVSFDIISQLTFSKKMGFVSQGHDIGGSIRSMRFLMQYQAVMGFIYWLHPFILHSPLAAYFGLTPHAHIFNVVSKAVQEREKNPGVGNDMVSQWVMNHKKWPNRMEDREILAVASMTTIAGSETMTGALESMFYWLLKHPDCMSKLKAELRQAQTAGELSDVVKDREAKRLPYLQACIKESLRYFAPVPFGLPRIAPKEGIHIGGHVFPEGVSFSSTVPFDSAWLITSWTILSVNPFVIQRDSRYFGADAETFNPERWFRSEAPTYEKYLITFGTGYNGCPGKQFAFAELGKIAATVLRDFDLEFDQPNTEWKHRSHFTIAQWDWPVRISPSIH